MTERSSFAVCLRFFFWLRFLLYTQKKMNKITSNKENERIAAKKNKEKG
jgi:hypothetical protein